MLKGFFLSHPISNGLVRLSRAILLALTFVATSAEATPKIVRIDGSIFDASGSPFTGNKDVQITAYDAASGGSLLWTSAVSNVVVSSGRFTLNLDAASGSSPSLVARIGERTAGQAIYFQVEVDSGTANGSMDSAQIVRPRVRGKGTLFALSSAQADSITGVTATSAELNALAGLTSSVQAQLNAKGPALSFTPLDKSGDSMNGSLTLLSQSELRLGDADGTFNYVALRAPTGVTSNVTLTLPATVGSSGQVLSTNGSGTLSWATASSGGSYTAGGAASHPSSGCPTGYIAVPGDTAFGTTDFCVMKYEAKSGAKGVESRAAGDPLRYTISQDTARSACRNLGPAYALINNAEWNTIAANIINQNGNWSSGTRGTGTVNRGHSD
ncbi:MAG: hypothetical protein JST16_03645, partial [Bdellovibrionales bacterium]|nr:hypothetical protein [Bdellovibrionales bacterium]